MDVNPYQPPVDAGPMRADEPNPANWPAPRPLGIWILAGLHLLVGLLFIALTVILMYAEDSGALRNINLPIWLVFALFAFMMVLALSSSAGMWWGAQWGWWLAAFYYVWAVLGVVADFLILISQPEQMEVGSILPALAGKLIQLAIHALILLYLFKSTVRDFFRLRSLRVHRALIPLAIVSIVVLAATYLALLAFQSADGA